MSALRQPAKPIGPQQGSATQPFNFDPQQLLAMIFAAQQQQQQTAVDASRLPPASKIAQSPRNGGGGLARWAEMNPHALPGESYASSNNNQRQDIAAQRANQDVQRRITMADLLAELEKRKNEMWGGQPGLGSPPGTGKYNPFAGF